MKIDSHQHFWRYSAQEYGWIDSRMAALKKDFLPANLAPLLDAAGIGGTVAVQARQSLAETGWLLELAGQSPLIKGVVGWVDLRSPNLPEQLQKFSRQPKFKGARHVVQDEPDDQFMLGSAFVRGIGLLAEFDLTYDILIYPKHLPVACRLVDKFPDQPFVLDHIAKPLIKNNILTPWEADIRRLAEFPNVYCKVSGMVTEANWQEWQPADFWPYLDVVFEAFGPQRLMFGSDWPVCALAGSYAQVVSLLVDYTRRLSAAGQAAVWGETAQRFYGLD